MAKNNKNTVANALIDAETMRNMIKEESAATIKELLKESIQDSLRESIEDEEDVEEDDLEIQEDEKEPTEKTEETDKEEKDEEVIEPEIKDEKAAEDLPEDDSENEWSEFDDYKVADNTYDLTGEKDGDVTMKVYKLLDDDDNVFVKKDGSKVTLKDENNDAEYVIDLDDSDDDDEETEFEFDEESMDECINNVSEGKMKRKSCKDDECIIEVDLGCEDEVNEPLMNEADDKDDDEILCDDKVCCDDCEIEEGTNVTGPNKRKKVKSHSPAPKMGPKVAHEDSKAGVYRAMAESIAKKAEAILKENQKLKSSILKLKNLNEEACVLNVSLGKIVKLFTENTVTQKEKVAIVERFSKEAKTVDQAIKLYESINRGLNNDAKKTLTLEKKNQTADGSLINEQIVYQSKDLLSTIDLMNRVLKY